MIRRPPRSTRMTHSFPTRRSSDLFDDLGYTNDEIAIYDVGLGFWAYLIGIFIGGILYSRMGMKRSVLLSLVLMAVSNFSFALLAAAGHSNWGMAGAIGFRSEERGVGKGCVSTCTSRG